MVFTNSGKQFLAWRLGSSLEDLRIQSIALGSGTTSALATNTTLEKENKRDIITSTDFSDSRKVQFQGDFSSVALSGLDVSEFGFLASGVSNIGSVQLRETFNKITFNGTNELQVVATIEMI